MPRRPSDSLIFDSLRLEGALFIPAVLEKAARGELPDQRTPSDYSLPVGLSLLDEQGRAFRIASALARTFEPVRARTDVDALRATSGFFLHLLRDVLGYADVTVCKEPVPHGDRAFPITALACGGRIPIVVAPHHLELDTPDERFAIIGSGARRRSAYQLAQQFLNASAECTWAIVTNGRQIRLLRDADTLTRPAFLEADLDLILREQRYADFAAVWRLFHASRAGQSDANAPWEAWRKQGQDQGERVRDGLRTGVTQALLVFGTGFLAHPANEPLRTRLQTGDLSVDAYFQQLLRLIYRCLFVFTAEERGLLHREDTSPEAREAREAYAAGYAFRRLRDRSLRRSGFDRHGDHWTACRIVFRGLATGESKLALPALGGLFSKKQCPDLDDALLENRVLLDAMHPLRWSGQGGSLAAIDYRNMGPEELGSVYESLLELVPTVDVPARRVGFVGLTSEGLTEGNARKTSGSYYTPDSLVQELLDSALDPVIRLRVAEAERMAKGEWRRVEGPCRAYFMAYAHPRLSRPGGLEAGPSHGQGDLPSHPTVPKGGTLRDDLADATSVHLHPGQHRGGLGTPLHGGVHPVLEDRQRQPDGAGDPSAPLHGRGPLHGGSDPALAGGTHNHGKADGQPPTLPLPENHLTPSIPHSPFPTPHSLLAPHSPFPTLEQAWDATPFAIRHSLLAAAALLSIAVIDPACGSGHFLLAAARRLAERLAELRAVEGAVTPADYRHALREVIARCIHGVDRNPMALELARTALWLEGFEPGQPLSFLDHHLVCGDALLGLIEFQSLTAGIPAEAFKPLTGDDKEACKALAAANRVALKAFERRRTDPDFFREADTRNLLDELKALEAMPEGTPTEVETKASAYTTFLQHARDSRLAQAADLVVAAFLSPKDSPTTAGLCPTTQTLGDLLFPIQGNPVRTEVLQNARETCRQARVLHWPLAFAGIFARGGFDCVLGNPPWEMLQLDPQEFFAARAPHVTNAQNMAARDREIAALRKTSPRLFDEYQLALRIMEATQAFVHANERFEHSGTGRINLSSLFTESCLRMLGPDGKAGIVSPSGVATDSFTQGLWNHITDGRLVSFFDFENREGLFPGVHRSYKFCLLTMGRSTVASFAFFLSATEQIRQEKRRFQLAAEDFRLINPNTRTCPIFRSQADAELTKKLYRRWPVLWREAQGEQAEENPWGLELQLMFMMNTDSVHFLNAKTPNSLPLYEAKMIHQFDHRWATYRWDAGEGEPVTDDVSETQKARPDFTVQPRYWVEERHVLSRLARVPRCVIKAWDEQSEDALRNALATWIVSGEASDALAELRGQTASPRQRVAELGGRLFASLPARDTDWFNPKAAAESKEWPPLSPDELNLLRDAPNLLSATRDLLDRRSPRWLMGWRDICRATDERTVIASVVPRVGVGNNMPLMLFDDSATPRHHAALLGNLGSLTLDFVARHKVGGTHLNYFIYKQLPILPPTAYTEADLAYIVPRVLELTYTAHDLKPWVEDVVTSYNAGTAAPIAIPDSPFPYDPLRRAVLRAELDAWYARMYGLTRDELRYILDPSDTHGPDYPTETFRGLKSNELRAFGEYRTRRLVLEAWDIMNR